MTAKFSLPPEQHHNWKYIAFRARQEALRAVRRAVQHLRAAAEYAQIRRYNPDGSGMEVIARGVRNTQGFDWHPKTGELWFTDHGRDWMGDDGPQDELNRMSKPGAELRLPVLPRQGVPDQDIKKADPCKGVTHAGGARWGRTPRRWACSSTPATCSRPQYQDTMFVARKGSWNRTQAVRLRRGEHQGRRRRQEPEGRRRS